MTIEAPLVHIALDGFASAGTGARPTNVFVVTGDRPALLGCGHPANVRQLVEALDALGIAASDIDRIIATSWDPTALGGHAAFPRAQLFVPSPDLVQPRQWNSWNDRRRARFLAVADEVFERLDAWGRPDLEAWLEAVFPRLTNHLDFVPIRGGQRITASDVTFEVHVAAKTTLLWSPELRVCVAHDLHTDGLPPFAEDAGEYIAAVEHALELEPRMLLTDHGTLFDRAVGLLRGQMRFCSNYLASAPLTLMQPKTVLDVAAADLGHVPEHPAPYIEAVFRHRPFLEELVRMNAVLAEGEGLDRTYVAG